jgi:hypothetical protein
MKQTVEKATFFHTLVIVGSSFALGCGTDSREQESDDEEIEFGGGSGGQSASGGAGSGGSPPIFTGTGGTVASGGSSMGGSSATDCPPEQWSCPRFSCSWEFGQEGLDCACDRDRPASVEDCQASERFVCNRGWADSTEGDTYRELRFGCACVEEQATCSDSCGQVGGTLLTTDCDFQELLCQCELPILR